LHIQRLDQAKGYLEMISQQWDEALEKLRAAVETEQH